MFGYGKKNVEKSAELLELGNIRLNCKPGEKEAVIREVGQLLYQCGCVEESYIEAMLQRELTFSTNIGNGIALPHGVEAAKKNRLSAPALQLWYSLREQTGGEKW